MPALVRFLDEHRVRIGDWDFYFSERGGSAPGHTLVMKSRRMVDDYISLSQTIRVDTIVELGILRGGSTAMLTELFQPSKLVAVELKPHPEEALTSYIAAQRLGDVVRPFYGVDQADQSQLEAILDAELGSTPVDLVIDDASHHYDHSVASFEVLFPRLAPGGLYIVEDWRAGHVWGAALEQLIEDDHNDAEKLGTLLESHTPLSRMMFELVLARATGEAVERVTLGSDWAIVERGAGRLDPEFKMADLYVDRFHQL